MIASTRDGLVAALLRAQIIRHGDCLRDAPWWPQARRQHEAAIAGLLGSREVSLPRLRLSSVKPKQRVEQSSAGGCEVHRFVPRRVSNHPTPDPIIPPRESLAVFPLTERRP